MRKTIAALLLFSLLIVGCSNNSLKSNDPDSVPTQNQRNNEQETQHQGNNIFEIKEDIQNGIKSKVAIKTYYEEPASLKDKNTIILNGLLKGEFVEVVVDKSYTLTVKTATAIMRANEGGVFGDPFETISVDRGSILLSFYGGSNWRWYKQYRFRLQDDGWYLIGATLGSYFTGTTTKENADEEDYNLLTGDYIIKKADEKGIVNTTKGNREKRKLINLNEFIVNSEEHQF